MRKLKLLNQISVDGYIAGPNGEMDWIKWNMDDKLQQYISELTDSSSTFLMGRKMAGGFMTYWSGAVADPSSPEHEFGKKMIDTPKVVFTKTMNTTDWVNTTLAKGDLTEEVNKLKKQEGKDIMLFGGATFAASMIRAGLVDEYHLLVNPTAIGKGMPIFTDTTELKLINVIAFECGTAGLIYQPK